MGRTAGATNKDKPISNRGLFLKELVDKYNYWTSEAEKAKDNGESAAEALEFAQFYQLGLNKFTALDE